MIAIIQRVARAKVLVDKKTVGQAAEGLLVLLGVVEGDTTAESALLARKTAALRIFCDENDKMNRSVLDISGEILVVSNFTLAADVRKGNRPSFIRAAQPESANMLYERFCEELRGCGVRSVEQGIFGADMQIEMTADGPITITLDTKIWKKPRHEASRVDCAEIPE